MVKLGVPYTDQDIATARTDMKEQALKIEQNLYQDPAFAEEYESSKKAAADGGLEFTPMNEREIIAMIAYLQRLGTDIKVKPEQTAQNH